MTDEEISAHVAAALQTIQEMDALFRQDIPGIRKAWVATIGGAKQFEARCKEFEIAAKISGASTKIYREWYFPTAVEVIDNILEDPAWIVPEDLNQPRNYPLYALKVQEIIARYLHRVWASVDDAEGLSASHPAADRIAQVFACQFLDRITAGVDLSTALQNVLARTDELIYGPGLTPFWQQNAIAKRDRANMTIARFLMRGASLLTAAGITVVGGFQAKECAQGNSFYLFFGRYFPRIYAFIQETDRRRLNHIHLADPAAAVSLLAAA